MYIYRIYYSRTGVYACAITHRVTMRTSPPVGSFLAKLSERKRRKRERERERDRGNIRGERSLTFLVTTPLFPMQRDPFVPFLVIAGIFLIGVRLIAK